MKPITTHPFVPPLREIEQRYGVVIVSRHVGAVEWLRRRGITGPVIEHAIPEDVRGKVVYGILPFHLAALAKELVMIDTPQIPLERRGGDLTPEEMDQYGATLTHYMVVHVRQTASDPKEPESAHAPEPSLAARLAAQEDDDVEPCAPEPKVETLQGPCGDCNARCSSVCPCWCHSGIGARERASEPKADRLSEAAEDLRLDLDIPGDEADDARRRIRAALESVVRSCAEQARPVDDVLAAAMLHVWGLEDHDGR